MLRASAECATDTLKSFHLYKTELNWQAAETFWSGLFICSYGDYNTHENTQNSFNLPLLGTRSHDATAAQISWDSQSLAIQDTLYCKNRRAIGTWAIKLSSASGMPGHAGVIPPQITPEVFLLLNAFTGLLLMHNIQALQGRRQSASPFWQAK